MEFSVPTYSTKENNIIQYVSGYVFSTIYGRLKFSKATQSMLGMQCLPLLLAGKSSLENSPTKNDSLIHAKDWNVTPEVYFIFSEVETLFRHATTTFDKQIDGKKMASQLLENPSVLSNFNKVRNQSAEKVSKEIALNVLDHLITRYIRVRTFSLVKDKREMHKIASKRKKARSLLTELKKSSSTLDQGH